MDRLGPIEVDGRAAGRTAERSSRRRSRLRLPIGLGRGVPFQSRLPEYARRSLPGDPEAGRFLRAGNPVRTALPQDPPDRFPGRAAGHAGRVRALRNRALTAAFRGISYLERSAASADPT